MEKNKIILFVLPILVLFLISVVSAQTLIAGKIYNSDFSDTISGADVSVFCNGNQINTISLDDGTYAIRFEEDLCAENDDVEVTASKSGFNEKTESSVISKCEDGDCGGNYFTIVNLGLEVKSDEPVDTGGSSSNRRRGSSGGFYLCGNGKCDTGETVNTCPVDCFIKENLDDENEGNTLKLEGDETQTGFSKITGAVVGVVGEGGFVVPLIFILVIVGLLIITLAFKKRVVSKKGLGSGSGSSSDEEK